MVYDSSRVLPTRVASVLYSCNEGFGLQLSCDVSGFGIWAVPHRMSQAALAPCVCFCKSL